MAGSAQTTTDHKAIRQWAEERGGRPAHVKGTGGKNDPGLLRIDFGGDRDDDNLEPIPWEEWFRGFDENDLAFLYEDEKQNRFNKLVSRRADA